NLRHTLRFNGAANVWYNLIFLNYSYYRLLAILPLLSGLSVALAQFLPEIQAERLKLTLHLPEKENRLFLGMLALGSLLLSLLFAVIILLFALLSGIDLPPMVVGTAVVAIVPWFLAGLTTYFLTSLIVIEPSWFSRLGSTLIACGLLSGYLLQVPGKGYGSFLPVLILLTLMAGFSVLHSLNRFRKGKS
ncbi:MAG: hypothetical protein LWW85_15040, partial [Marinilabiliales bacterium]|nr:hypothetical protein [Marinilabiliales bacterium]